MIKEMKEKDTTCVQSVKVVYLNILWDREVNWMKIEDFEVYGLIESIVASRFPMDTGYLADNFNKEISNVAELTEEDIKNLTAFKLANSPSGSGHDCWLKGVIVQANITAPAYWTIQEYRYHFRDTISSQSKMHKIEFLLKRQNFPEDVYCLAEKAIERYKAKEIDIDYLMHYIPLSWELTYREMFSYLQLKTIYAQRRNHKSKQWQVFCDWIEELPCSFLITESYNDLKKTLKKLFYHKQGFAKK